MKIIFIQTGGTIDKKYPKTVKGYAFEIGEPAIERILEKVNPKFEYEVIPLLKKDSLDITDEDREKILLACKKAPSDRLIITHGTDTMVQTARKVHQIKNKTIVITGSLRPEKFSDSDAMFNAGAAVAAVQTLPPGVYIAMSGRVYPWNKVKKSTKTGQFVDL